MTANSNKHAKAQAVPKDYGSITPYIVSKSAEKLLTFLTQAFDAQERGRVYNDDGTIGHAEVWIGDSVVQMFDAKPNWPETPSFITLYVDDCDATHRKALAAGGTEITPLSTNAWGDRGSRVRDPLGNIWWIQTHVEDVDEAEIGKRMQEPTYLEGMQVAQSTFEQEMNRRMAR